MPRARRSTADRVTRSWLRGPADERAVKNGCRFDEERGRHAVDWVGRYCRLYEGEHAGELMELRDWQFEVTMRLFGWVRFSEDWGREVRRFRRAGVWVPKKNKKSPTLAAWGLYLLCGDGEQGQKVYSVAKDGRQAMISHTHAVEMVRRSPDLMAECTVNKSTGQIAHLPTSSVYKVVAGDNPQSQEGLNGSLMVDETHVVDRKLMKILRGAGISRAEPLHVEVSTAGNNPQGYGKERFDYGRKVESGEFEDEQLLYAAWCAPQDLSDADLDADPVKWGKLANPSWGHTIKPTEYLSDYAAARSSLSDLADFKMYRLNVWQQASSPWLKESDWALCRRDFAEDDLAGRECWAALDLSRTRDMSALVLTFRGEEPEAWYQLYYFWLPEQAAREKNHLAPFLSWASAGFLELTPGGVIDYGFIRSRFRRVASKFRVRELTYDYRFAEETTQSMSEGVRDETGRVVEEGTGVARTVFPQTVAAFAGPTAEFERLVIAHKLWHNGNPVMSWQVSHAQVRTDSNANKRPVKPSVHDHRKIDGVVAGIMSLFVAQDSDSGSVYDSEGIFYL